MEQGKDGVKHEGKRMTQFFGGEDQSPPQSLPQLQILIPYKKHPLKFTAFKCKVRDGKEEDKSLTVFYLRKYKCKCMLFCKYTFECISNSIVFYLKT